MAPRSCLRLGLALAALAMAATPAGAAEVWLPVEGMAMVQGGAEAAERQAERTALGQGLATFLTGWLAEDEIRQHAKLLERSFFRQPHTYLKAVSDVSDWQSGSRYYWRAKAKFHTRAVAQELRRIGLISPWDRDPVFALREIGHPGPPVTAMAWTDALAEAGVQLRYGELTTAEAAAVDGRWYLEVATATVPHPLVPERAMAVTTALLRGDIHGRELRHPFVVAPAELAPPAELVAAQLVDTVIRMWAPRYLADMEAQMWEAGEFRFGSAAQWSRFDRELMAERDVFHYVHPIAVRRTLDALYVRYGFFLNPGAEATAAAWLINHDFPVRQGGERRFVVDSPPTATSAATAPAAGTAPSAPAGIRQP